MEELISKQAAIDAAMQDVSCIRTHEFNAGATRAANRIKQLPSVEPKKGKWNRLDMDTFNCNKCGATFVLIQGGEKMHFCPNCMADMRGVTT